MQKTELCFDLLFIKEWEMEFIGENTWVFFLVLVAVIIFMKSLYEKRRTEALELQAQKMGFSFSKLGRESTRAKYANFELFSEGYSKKFKNEIWGVHNKNDVSIFGYSYTQGHGRNSSTYTQTVLSIDCGKLNSPNFYLKPENTLHKIGQFFGYKDIDFKSSPVFSDKYLLRGSDTDGIRKFFSPTVLRFFELNLGIYMEVQDGTLIFYKPSKRIKPEEIKAFFNDGESVLSALL